MVTLKRRRFGEKRLQTTCELGSRLRPTGRGVTSQAHGPPVGRDQVLHGNRAHAMRMRSSVITPAKGFVEQKEARALLNQRPPPA